MKKINFLFGIHNHQPIGNFNSVFEDSFKKCYLPFIKILERHPKIRVSLHYSGCLLEWIENNNPEYFDRIKELVERNQIEILSGGFYEPILSTLPEDDAVNQIQLMTEYIKENFDYYPKGIWLAERIWEPSLPKIISKADMKYTILDDTHFFYTGLEQKDMFDYYITEKHGHTLSIFPIDKFLRYSIPFKLPHEIFDYFKKIIELYGINSVTYADDGEKFGIWPGTHKWVYEENWLENFFSAIEENMDWIEMPTFSEYIEKFPPHGRVYLPISSYEEMMEWSLTAKAGIRFEEILKDMENRGLRDKYKSFIRGGLWDNFLVKYDEGNLMHKKMLYVSEKIRERGLRLKKNRTKAPSAVSLLPELRELYRGQCNCAYWHGLFGGLYLNYLRHAVYEHLIEAENIVDRKIHRNKNWLECKVKDYDKDNLNEVLISNSRINAYFDPDYGGSLFEFDYRPKRFNILNTMTRREEAYHYKVKNIKKDCDVGQPKSIHEVVKVKENGLGEMIIYDWYRRRSFLDHFLGEGTNIQNFMRSSYPEVGDFVDKPYNIEDISKNKKGAVNLKMKRNGHIYQGGIYIPLSVSKTFNFSMEKAAITSSFVITNMGEREIDAWFGIEFNMTLLAGDSDLRHYICKETEIRERILKSVGDISHAKSFGMRDTWNCFQIILSFEEPASIWYFPIETVSQSEDGFERIYQGSTILAHWKIRLKEGESRMIKLELGVEEF